MAPPGSRARALLASKLICLALFLRLFSKERAGVVQFCVPLTHKNHFNASVTPKVT